MAQVLNSTTDTDAVEGKRRLVFGCLMQYSAESIPLRDRALEGAVLTALVGGSVTRPFKNGDVQRNLKAGNIDLRPELVRDTLDRLIQKGLVHQAEQRKKDVYYLTDAGEARTKQGTYEAKSLLEPVLNEVLEHADESLDRARAALVLEDFICTSFARFGASIAGYLTGRTQQFANFAELSVTFDEVAAKHFIPSESRESLKARCMSVFRARSLEPVS